MRTGDTPADERRAFGQPATGHPGHHARVAVPAADVAGARGAARRRVGHRRRDPRAWPARSAARTWRCRWSGSRRSRDGRRSASGCRRRSGRWRGRPAFWAAAPFGDDGSPRPVRDRRRRRAQDSSNSRWSCRSRTWPPSARYCRRAAARRLGRQRRTRGARSGRRSIPRILELDPSASLDDRLRQLPPPGRAPGACGSNELAGEELVARPPRLARARAAAADRGDAEGRPAAGAGGHVQPRAGHRHGRGRPRDPGRVAGSVARGLQRIGRAGHQVGEPSKGVIFPKYRGDLLECAVVDARACSTARSSRR